MLSARVTINVYETPANMSKYYWSGENTPFTCKWTMRAAASGHRQFRVQQRQLSTEQLVRRSESTLSSAAGAREGDAWVCSFVSPAHGNGRSHSVEYSKSVEQMFISVFSYSRVSLTPVSVTLVPTAADRRNRRQRHGSAYADVHSSADINSLGKHRAQNNTARVRPEVSKQGDPGRLKPLSCWDSKMKSFAIAAECVSQR